ncbi:MFS transporter [Paludibacterium sp. THUN1379]|uniref:MFS transporter n=1 Tax=Paludibacterium sp. THUN1379 TaxID=3112107 RepID=UPI0030897F1F|nr:MFS transporter [Paludibacterium sp. THUN1379]
MPPTQAIPPPARAAVWSLSLCVGLLIAAEFMPVSLLTPMARDLQATDGMAGQAISLSGLFAVLASLTIARLTARLDRKRVLLTLAGLMLLSLLLMAQAADFTGLMLSRALLGLVIGGFWSLATATVSRLVPAPAVPAALGTVYMGNAVATTLAAPLGSYLGGLIGWRGVFWLLVPLAALNLLALWRTLPVMPRQAARATTSPWQLLRRRHVRLALPAVMLTFAGAFCAFTYFRPFLEQQAHVSPQQLSLMLFSLGIAGLAGTRLATALLPRHLYRLLGRAPLALTLVTLALLMPGASLWEVAMLLFVWGCLNAAIPVGWSAWLALGVADQQESAGGLLVAGIQLAILLGGLLGGTLLDHLSIQATLLGAGSLMLLATLLLGNGQQLQPARPPERQALLPNPVEP